jgi:hypothetical protein
MTVINAGAVPGAGNWGDIGGTLSDQADLQSELNAKGNLAGGNTWDGLQTVTPAVGSSAIVVAGVAQTTSRPVLDLAQTWNAGGVTFTGLKLNVTGTASTAASLLMDLQVGGSTRFAVRQDGRIQTAAEQFSLLGGSALQINSGNLNDLRGIQVSQLALGVGSVVLLADAANILAQRNGTAAQAFRVYNTWADASNGEWFSIDWASNIATIGPKANGTGTVRNLYIVAGNELQFITNGVQRSRVDSNGVVIAQAGKLLWAASSGNGDIGLSDGTFSPSQIFCAGRIVNTPPASLTLSVNGQAGLEMTSNTTGNLVYRGSDGTTRRMALTFS